MHQEISEFVNLFIEKHFYLKDANFLPKQSNPAWLSWLERLSSEQEIVSSKLIVALFLAAKYQMAVKNRIAMSFELTIFCLLDRRYNLLSHAVLLLLGKKLTLAK